MKKFLLFVSGLLVAGGSAAGVIFFFYQDGMPFQEEGTPPLVQADENPFKIRPENPEGMEFAHRDNTAYEAIENPESLVDDGVISLQDPPDLPTSPAFDDDPGSDNPYQEDGALPSEALALLGDGEQPAGAPVMTADDGRADREPVIAAPDAAPAANEAGQETEVSPPLVPQTGDAVPEKKAGAGETVTAKETAAGAVTPAAPASAAPQVALSKAVRIQLGSLRSRALAEREWKRLAGRHGALLGTLTLHVQQADLGARGVFYRVQAGPFATGEAARSVCRQLESRKVGCLVVRP